jgi:hypothetical protein
MSTQKQFIPIEKIEQVVTVLACLQRVAADAVTQLNAADLKGFQMEGWTTLCRGMEYTADQLSKLAGPADPIHQIDFEKVRLESTNLRIKKALDLVASPDASYEPSAKENKRKPEQRRRKAKE